MDGFSTTRRRFLQLGGAAAITTATGAGVVTALPAVAGDEVAPSSFHLGTYTSAGGPGIVRGLLDPATGALTVQDATAAVSEASWLTRSPAGSILYAISERDEGTVSALTPDLALLGTAPTGNGPAHVAVHPDGTFLFVSLYGEGAVVTHPINADGTPAPATDRRRQGTDGRPSHAHQVVVDPFDAYVLAVDLGRDAVFTYRLDAQAGSLAEVARADFPAGTGPRHIVFHPSGSVAYVAGELNSTVTVCAYADGVLEPGQVIAAAPAGEVTDYPGEIAIAADGRHVYVSNRGSNTVGVFSTGADGTVLERLAAPTCGGDWPRHLAIDPSGRWLHVANQRSGTVTWLPITDGIPGAVAGSRSVPGVAQILPQPA
ncbi:lactonase family protein [Actinoplanes sp. NPDC051494]|uniref:lactonase family protein n=1 Tax=Actinoplanes sp. NPDC051494 TaxID=3363907 RepID=UPI0037AF16AD